MAIRTPFSLNNLNKLDFGAVDAAFAHELNYAVTDCLDRPGEMKPRTINIQFTVIPKPDPGSVSADQVEVSCLIKSKIPIRRTKVYTMTPVSERGKRGLVFNPDLPEDPDQPTLLDSQEHDDDEQRRKDIHG